MCCEMMKVTENKKRASEIQETRQKAADDIKQDLINDTVREVVQSIIRITHSELKTEALENMSCLAMESVLEVSVRDALLLVVKEVYDKERRKWENCVKKARRKTELLRARKVLLRWERACIARRKLEACRNTFPSNPMYTPIMKFSESIVCESFSSVIRNKNRIRKLLDAAVLHNIIKEELSWHPLDLSKMFDNNLPYMSCWKLLLIIPVKENDADWTIIASWLCAKFGKGYIKPDSDPGTKLCSLYFLPLSSGDKISICVRAFFIGTDDFSKNLEVIQKQRFLEGASAAVLLMPYCETDCVFQRKIFEHLKQLLAVKSPIPSIPLYCFLACPKTLGSFETQEKLIHVMNEGYICDYQISHLCLNSGLLGASEELQIAVDWLLDTQSPVPVISHAYLKDYVENCLVQVFNVIYHDVMQRQKQKKEIQNPSIIVSFYNAVMTYWMQTATSADLISISWPPPEISKDEFNSVAFDFGWNSFTHLNKIKDVMSRFILPEFPCMPISHEDLGSYIEGISKMCHKNPFSLHSSVADILEKSQDRKCEKEYSNILWAEIIWECIHYLVSCETFQDEATGKELEVSYISEGLKSFDYYNAWRQLNKEANGGSRKRRYVSNSEDAEEYEVLKLHSTTRFHETQSGRLPISFASFQHSDNSCKLPEDMEFLHPGENFVTSFSSSQGTNHFEVTQISSEFSKAFENEKLESEAYISALESSINDGQFLEKGIPAESSEICTVDTDYFSNLLPSNCCFVNKVLFEPDLQGGIEALNESIEAQYAANKLFDKRIHALTSTNF